MMRRVIHGCWICLVLCNSTSISAMDIGSMTFAMPADKIMVSKAVHNNNESLRFYQVSIQPIVQPGESEQQRKAIDGEILFAPKRLQLQAGQGDFFKFYYHGPADGNERYYRVRFEESPAGFFLPGSQEKVSANFVPIVAYSTILVVRPRQLNFSYQLDETKQSLQNNGNTFFKVLLKTSCSQPDSEAFSAYLPPGAMLQNSMVSSARERIIVYDNRFLRIGQVRCAQE